MGKRLRLKKKRSDVPVLDETIFDYLVTGVAPARETVAWRLYVSRHFDDGELIEAVREFYCDEISKEKERRKGKC